MSGTKVEGIKPLKKRRKNQADSGDEKMDLGQPPTLQQRPVFNTGQEEAAPLRSFPVLKQTGATLKIRSRSTRVGPISC